MKMFDQLLAIKAAREAKAQRALGRQRTLLEEAVLARDEAQRRLDEYREYATAQERKLYKGLCESVVKLHQIESVNDQARALRERQTGHEGEARDAETRRGKEERQLDTDRAAYSQARQVRERFEEVAQIFSVEEQREGDAREEAEIQESVEARGAGVFVQGSEA